MSDVCCPDDDEPRPQPKLRGVGLVADIKRRQIEVTQGVRRKLIQSGRPGLPGLPGGTRG